MRFQLLYIACFVAAFANGQTFNSFYNQLVQECNQDTITTYLEEFESLGLKEIGSVEIDNTYDWLVSKYTQFGYTDIAEDPFVYGGVPASNLIVTKLGTVYPNTFVIIDGHFDTRNGPGANDNGSGTVIILELARLLRDVPTEYSIAFVHFNAEEIGLVGSNHFVNDEVIANNMDIRLVFNIDEVGGVAGMVNDIITCEKDISPPSTNDALSEQFTNQLATNVELYSNLSTEISFAYGSDYVPFMNNGNVVTGLYETNESPYVHSINDSISRMDLNYLFELTKASMGSLAHFAIASEPLGLTNVELHELQVFPNPSDGELFISSDDFINKNGAIAIHDLTGSVVFNTSMLLNGSNRLNLHHLQPGAYYLILTVEGVSVRRKFVIK